MALSAMNMVILLKINIQLIKISVVYSHSFSNISAPLELHLTVLHEVNKYFSTESKFWGIHNKSSFSDFSKHVLEFSINPH